jgi:hypothetical protein
MNQDQRRQLGNQRVSLPESLCLNINNEILLVEQARAQFPVARSLSMTLLGQSLCCNGREGGSNVTDNMPSSLHDWWVC